MNGWLPAMVERLVSGCGPWRPGARSPGYLLWLFEVDGCWHCNLGSGEPLLEPPVVTGVDGCWHWNLSGEDPAGAALGPPGVIKGDGCRCWNLGGRDP